MIVKKQIAKIKKRVTILHIVAVVLLAVNAIVWVSTLIAQRNNDFILLVVGLSCVGFLIAIILVGIFVEKRIKKHLKGFVEKFAGVISDEDVSKATELLKKWKKHYIASIKWVLNEFREEKYPFGNNIIEDLVSLKKGIKIEIRPFYPLLESKDFGGTGNQILSEISMLVKNNSYTLDE